MDLSKYDGKHVRITDKWGETFADRPIEEIEGMEPLIYGRGV